jgi:hypothetical protein
MKNNVLPGMFRHQIPLTGQVRPVPGISAEPLRLDWK